MKVESLAHRYRIAMTGFWWDWHTFYSSANKHRPVGGTKVYPYSYFSSAQVVEQFCYFLEETDES